ncbi:LLM class flavin-dependent oxidoreductase [Pseudonocardia sp. TRM90224]|uniref:LLM class flavin-dependent oxidoreductase n=1 Tax=Pseudonocardia sp. TRM90224 TaxID=2812678 RepID=UPI001E5B788C|nr:LLM class flavin-dependent oxidoreductase [Pseudonocardia sp. TRM90224]
MIAVGVVLPSLAVVRDQRLDLAAAARHVEEAGLDSAWHGDHLAPGGPVRDCTVALAVAATATRRITVGTSVYVPAIRPLAWAAKQIATLVEISGGRFVLGVGSGGGPEQWAAAGVPYDERGARTDTALELLPALLAGEPVTLPDGAAVTLAPAVAPPPVWVGNASAVALRRAARFGAGWFPSLITAAEVAAGVATLAAAQHRPTVAIGMAGALGAGVPARTEIAAGIASAYGRPVEEVASVPLSGGPGEVAEQLAAYAAAGASHAVIGIAGGDWRRQVDLLAEAKTLLVA